ncbi:hypothetical protein C7M84_022296 [Penaeus vannamei]|uniref:Retropepsins domain-containing protein n=1 Tax=Penaeus vannamei TaxID=6689 RepID=A0A3R7NDX0_PENVA|nr:hypothetical protein C7M84_022296 [Penaeus vannamei]
MQLAEAAQRIWNSRNGIQHGTTPSRQMSMDDLGDHHRFPERPPRSRDVYAILWLNHHHTLFQSIARMVELPTSLAKPQPGAITTGTQTHTSISVSTVNATGPSGRPLVALRANDQTVLCFLDTGSEATLIRPSILRRLDPQNNLRRIRSSKLLRGVTGQPLATTSEVTLHFQLDDDLFIPHQVTLVDVTYPGDILLGMDFLRRLDFSLTHDPNTTSSCLSLEGRPFSVVYTDVESLHVRVISTTASNPETPAEFSTEMLPTQDHKHSPGIAVHLTAQQSKTVLARSDVCPVKTDSPAIEVPEDKASSLRAQARPSSDDFSEEEGPANDEEGPGDDEEGGEDGTNQPGVNGTPFVPSYLVSKPLLPHRSVSGSSFTDDMQP